MTDIPKLARIQLVFMVLFVFFKFIRPPVLRSEAPEIFKTILLSLPNFFESVIGTLVLTILGLFLRAKLLKTRPINLNVLYISAVILTGIFVSTQELKIHNLGGKNVYDPNDLIFSGIGLLTGYLIVLYVQPRYSPESAADQ